MLGKARALGTALCHCLRCCNMAQVFARGQDADFNGLTPGFLEGPMHQVRREQAYSEREGGTWTL